MIKQCKDCFLFNTPYSSSCEYCGSYELVIKDIDSGSRYKEYKIDTGIEIPIDGKNYRVEGLINRGGSCTILKVSDPSDMKFALKVPFSFDANFSSHKGETEDKIDFSVHTLENEIENFKRLPKSDSFLFAYSYGTTRIAHNNKVVEFPYILMELANTTVKHLILKAFYDDWIIAPKEKLKIISDFIESLRAFHEQNLYHRDLAPDNILCVNRNGKLQYIITDYGTSKQADSSTQSSQILAHKFYLDPWRQYMPSQFRLDERCDIYSAGVIISEILAGAFWVDIAPVIDFSSIDMERDFLDPILKHKIDPDFLSILKRMTTLDSEKRYPNINMMYQDLRAYLGTLKDENLVVSSQNKQLLLNFKLIIPLPLDLSFSDHDDIKSLNFKTDKYWWELRGLGGYRIHFPNMIIDSATINNPPFYSINLSHRYIDLVFDKDRFLSLHKKLSTYIGNIKKVTDGGSLVYGLDLVINYRRL